MRHRVARIIFFRGFKNLQISEFRLFLSKKIGTVTYEAKKMFIKGHQTMDSTMITI